MLTLRRLRAFGPAVSAFALALAGCTAGVSDASSSADPDGLVVTPPTWTIPPLLEHDPFTVPRGGAPAPTPPEGERVSAEDGLPGAALGHSVAIHGGTAVAGAPGEQRVYFLLRSERFWKIVGAIDSPDPDAADFGASVAWNGKHLAVGARNGRAFLYRRVGREWKLLADVPDDLAGAGVTAVALPGSDWAVGSGDDVRIFAIGEEGVRGLGQLRPSLAAVGFGRALATDGERLLVGAPGEAGGGAAYLFVRDDAGSWKLAARLGAGTGDVDTGFAEALALSADVAMIGAPRAGRFHTGRVRVFTDTGVEWKETGVLTATRPQPKDLFGSSIALAPGTAVVGSGSDDGRGPDAGAVYVFDRAGTYAWSFGEVLGAPDAGPEDHFGAAVATDGHAMIIGAPSWDEPVLGTAETGAVYFF